MQAGAISAIVLLYWRPLWTALGTLGRTTGSGPNLWLLILAAALPATVLGLLLDDWLDAHLFRPGVVAGALVVGGLLLWLLETWFRARPEPGRGLGAFGYRAALGIGLFQCLALVPGTSRSGAMLAGGMLLGLSRPAAAEFSFLVGIPILYGACSLRVWKHWDHVTGPLLLPFLVATLVSFLAALVVVRPFVRFLRRHTLVPFAIYRIVAGTVLAVLCLRGAL
jgi:undecaprenyl-diphosphatase